MKLQRVMARRADLLQRISRQRSELEALIKPYQGPLSLIDKGYAISRQIRSSSAFALGAGVLAIILVRKPKLISRLTSAAVTATGAWLALKNMKVTTKFFQGLK